MLISFSVANFRSFREEQTLSMVASARQPDHPDHLTSIPDVDDSVLPVAVIYGANGAGKSNLVKALMLVKRLVLKGTQPDKPITRQPFLFGGAGVEQPSSFEIRFTSGTWAFNYGFKVTEKEVSEEWLTLLRKNGEITLFERVTKSDGTVVVDAGDGLSDDGLGKHEKVVALTRVGVRSNQLFLAAIRESLDASSQGPLIQEVLKWFAALGAVAPAASFGALTEWLAQDSFADFAGAFLRDASTGVDKLTVETSELDETTSGLSPDLVRELIEEAETGEFKGRRLGKVGDIVAQRGPGTKLLLRTIRAEHKASDGKSVPLPFQEESDGTQRLTHLLPALFLLKSTPRVYVIDEIDRSLHPLLARKFIEFFLQACKGRPSQIIVTTHESNLMDLDLLRRDELWFTEKNDAGATSLYSLSDFKVRTDLKIDKGYLHGRFGAIPFLGNLDRLLKQLQMEGPCR